MCSPKLLTPTYKYFFTDISVTFATLYVKKGVKEGILDLVVVEGMNKENLVEWITEVFEPP